MQWLETTAPALDAPLSFSTPDPDSDKNNHANDGYILFFPRGYRSDERNFLPPMIAQRSLSPPYRIPG